MDVTVNAIHWQWIEGIVQGKWGIVRDHSFTVATYDGAPMEPSHDKRRVVLTFTVGDDTVNLVFPVTSLESIIAEVEGVYARLVELRNAQRNDNLVSLFDEASDSESNSKSESESESEYDWKEAFRDRFDVDPGDVGDTFLRTHLDTHLDTLDKLSEE